MQPAPHPGFSAAWRPPPALSSTPDTFNCFCFFIYCGRYSFEWAFITHKRFWHYPKIFDSSCFYQGLPGRRQFFLEVCRASCWSLKHRAGPSVCLIHNNPQSSYSEEFMFKSYQMLLWITCGKRFNLSAPYLFGTLFSRSKPYVKTIKKHFEQDLYYI